MLLVGLVGLVAAQAATVGHRAALRGSERARGAARLLELDSAVRQALARVRVPYWVGAVEVRMVGDSLEIPFIGGERAECVRIEASDGWVTLSRGSGRGALRIGPFADACAAAVLEDGTLWGVELSVRLGGGEEPIRLRARIGSRPLGAGGAP